MLLGCENWCRLCGRDIDKGINISIKNEYFPNVYDAIQKLLSININKTDIIPTEICNDCNTNLYNLIEFYNRCKKTQDMYAEISYNSENLRNKMIDLNEFRKKYINNNKQFIENIVCKNDEYKNEILEKNNKTEQLRNEKKCSSNKYKIKYSCKTKNYNQEQSNCNLNSIEINLNNIEIEKFTNNNDLVDCNIFQEDLYKSFENNNNCVKKIENSLSTTTKTYCEICKKLFNSNRGYGIHLKMKHSIHRDPIDCKYCGKTFKIMALLKKHENSHLPSDKKKFYPCKKCDKKFSSDSGLWSHIHTVHEKNHSVICEECGKEFPTSSYLKSHKLSHKIENDFQCPKCPMKLKRKKTLMIHLQTHGENFICPICGIQLNTKKTLRDHMIVHSDEKKYKCNICDKNFKREKTLNSHLILHTGLKPYECEYCKKRFSHGSNFRTHQKKSHPLELADRDAKGEKRICKEIPKAKLLKEFNK